MPSPTLRLRQFLKDGVLRYPAWFNHKSPQNSLFGADLASEVLFPEKFSGSAEVLANTASVFLLRLAKQSQTQLGHPSRTAHIDSCPGGRCSRCKSSNLLEVVTIAVVLHAL
jgi:hypothetical protein